MNHKSPSLPAVLAGIAALVAAQMACNLPASMFRTPAPAQSSELNLTLTAIFAPPPAGNTATPTLPPVNTPTTSPGESGGGIGPTATQPAPAVPTATAVPAAANTPIPTATSVPPTATNTRVPPTNTSAPAAQRQVFVAQYLSTPPTIDGDWGEWKTLTTEYPANAVVWGRGNWTGADDLSSSFHIGWDNQNLYLAVKVRDDKYVQNATGANIYEGDSIELLLDTKLAQDVYYNRLSADDFQLGINPGRPDPAGTREAYLWFPSTIAGNRANVTIASLQEDGVYRVEAAIPWSVFEITSPANGSHYGFALSVSDNDNPNANEQQSMVSNDPRRVLADPTTWAELALKK